MTVALRPALARRRRPARAVRFCTVHPRARRGARGRQPLSPATGPSPLFGRSRSPASSAPVCRRSCSRWRSATPARRGRRRPSAWRRSSPSPLRRSALDEPLVVGRRRSVRFLIVGGGVVARRVSRPARARQDDRSRVRARRARFVFALPRHPRPLARRSTRRSLPSSRSAPRWSPANDRRFSWRCSWAGACRAGTLVAGVRARRAVVRALVRLALRGVLPAAASASWRHSCATESLWGVGLSAVFLQPDREASGAASFSGACLDRRGRALIGLGR